jgi:hypothetical protein
VLLLALLECSNPRCDAAYEGYGTAAELRRVPCEECGHELEAVAYAEADPASEPAAPSVRQRRAA